MMWALIPLTWQRLIIKAGAICAILLTAWWFGSSHYEKKGEFRVVEASKQHGKQANDANKKVRDAAASPGAAQRVRAEFCRDCE